MRALVWFIIVLLCILCQFRLTQVGSQLAVTKPVTTGCQTGLDHNEPVLCGPVQLYVVLNVTKLVAVPVHASNGKKPDLTGLLNTN